MDLRGCSLKFLDLSLPQKMKWLIREELRIIVSESYKNGEINQYEFKYVNNIFEFDDRIAKEIMVPRTEIATLSIDDTIEEIFSAISNENYTRYPVIDGDKDHVIGMVNTKELFTYLISHHHNLLNIDRYPSNHSCH